MVALGPHGLGHGRRPADGRRRTDAGLLWPETPKPVFSLAIRPHNRQDEVKLTASLAKLTEEDPSLVLVHNDDTARWCCAARARFT
jgi:elongation factor G